MFHCETFDNMQEWHIFYNDKLWLYASFTARNSASKGKDNPVDKSSSARQLPGFIPLSGWIANPTYIRARGFRVVRSVVYNYFVDRGTISTGCQGDFRALDQGSNLYRSRHVTVVEWHNDIQCCRGMVRPTMKKDRLHRVYNYCNGLQKI